MQNSPALDDSELILVKGRANDEHDLRLCDPLDETFIADLLVALGEPRPTPADLVGSGADDYEAALASGSLLQLVSADGAVRSVFLERGEATDDDWIRLYDIVAERARIIGAYFGSEDGWTVWSDAAGATAPRVTITKYLLNGLIRGLLIGGGLGGLIRPIGWVPGAIAGVIVGVAAGVVLWRLSVARARN